MMAAPFSIAMAKAGSGPQEDLRQYRRGADSHSAARALLRVDHRPFRFCKFDGVGLMMPRLDGPHSTEAGGIVALMNAKGMGIEIQNYCWESCAFYIGRLRWKSCSAGWSASYPPEYFPAKPNFAKFKCSAASGWICVRGWRVERR